VRRWLWLAALLAATAGWSGSETQERELRRAIAESDRGMAALEKGNLKKAREAFDRALTALPDFPQGHLGLGHLAMRERRFDDALREFKSAEDGYKGMSSITVQLEADRYARSRDELTNLRVALTQLEGDSRKSQTMLETERTSTGLSAGQVERELARVRSRIQTLEGMNPPSSRTIREAPAEILFFQGNALFNLKRLDEAIAAWEAALKRDPKQPLVENNLAVAYWKAGRFDDARAAMLRSETLGFKVNPNFRADLEKALSAAHR